MNTYTAHTASENTENQVWENFVEYLETIYFDGAAEMLNKELVAFEYHQYRETFAA
jgi:hypothetical protein